MSAHLAPEESIRVYYRGNKYDVPLAFATKMHPGGKDILMRYQDSDITRAFDKTQHSRDAFRILQGWAADSSGVEEAHKATSSQADEQPAKKPSSLWSRLVVVLGLASVVAAAELHRQ